MHEIRFRAMGCDCHIVVLDGSEDLVDRGRARVDHLDAIWSRFRPDSELCRLNAAGPSGLEVSAETITLVSRGVRAQRLTGGWFDPFMGRDITRLGYDRDFADLLAPTVGVATTSLTISAEGVVRTPPRAQVAVDLATRTVVLPDGFDFDSGGIGKGLAADLVSADLVANGARGALVNVGGDLRCRGASPDDGWVIAIEDPRDTSRSRDEYVRITDGAVATSTALKRRWRDAVGREHSHLLDPRTGESTDAPVASVTVIAPAGWIAEALAKAVLIGGPAVGVPLLAQQRAGAIAIGLDGSSLRLP